MDDKIKRKFKRYSKEYEKIRLESVKLQRKHDDVVSESKDSKSKKLSDALTSIKEKEDAFTEKYAYEVFSVLSKIQPVVIRKRDLVEMNWDEAFGDDFSKLSYGLKQSLIALIEGSGGQFRIKE